MSKIEKIKQQIKGFITANHEPKQIALGVAIGVFIGISPLYGLQTAIALLIVLLMPKINKVSVILGTQISLPPIYIFICLINHRIGKFVLRKPCSPLSLPALGDFTRGNLIDTFMSLSVGSFIFGMICSTLVYFLTLNIVVILRSKRNRK